MKLSNMIHAARLFIATSALLASSFAGAATQLLDQVIAVVDNDVVMNSELEQRMQMVVSQLRANQTTLPPEEVLREQILEQLINESLQLQLGRRYGIQISDEELDATINRMREANQLSPEQFAAQLAQDGLSIPMLREHIRREMIIDQVQKGSVNQRINISNREIENFLKSKQGKFWSSPDYNLGHILVAVPSTASNEEARQAEQKAQDIYQRLLDGADFRQLAVAESQGQNALSGGDMGWRKSAQMPELFANSIESLQEGEVSPPLRSGAGFHILKLYGKRGDQEQLIQQAKVRHILIKPSAILSDEEAKAKLAQVREKILAGADFAEMAKANSEDVGSMLSGGDLGWSLPGKFVPEFERTINNTAVGEISQPFRSQFGWHILQVQERRQQDMSEQVRINQANMLLRSRRFDEERINWLQEIRSEAYVEIK
ncbi:peptidylprolyl isomerase [Pseudomaricurvus alcaniphilus]|uniref:peptidylprolyl isomerase n=1 Tax=Pseudomaricurvus alcaniphilus TaxID=1166482 RepID=UPI001A9D395F|nr:peptidylprolyl isomerase [Pseudomaricurvus alcaniphilus]